ncbi:metallophosphoesterase [Methanococcoides sp. LMO-2]|uniref:Metallophosphoesterase n=1 Tax=Methanococcoides cohabitans TaxID=3136559 RepID=A0ABU9KQQ4_9EURY
MKDIILMHIGDIHFKNIIKMDMPINIVDTQESLNVIDRNIHVSRNKYEIISESLLAEIQNSTVAILISGDLTTNGEVESYNDCLDFLKSRIDSEFLDSECFQKLFLVPGNHDIDRKKIDDNDYIPKFEPMIDALQTKNFPDVPCDDIMVEKICEEDSFSKLLVISVNSCIGCGENKYFPPEIRDHLTPLLTDYEVMDTPLIANDHIDKMIEAIMENNDFLPLILTHHNLLPLKRTNYVTIHADLINSGILREKLLMLNKPILYLHGHIHDDPIEIIQSPNYEKSKIICISAPLLFPIEKIRGSPKFGFNKIRIISGNSSPIGCEIISYRLINNKVEKISKRIPFFCPPKSMALITDDDEFVLGMLEDNTNLYFNKVASKIRKSGQNIEDEELIDILERLSWLGLIEYGDDDDDIKMRCMKRLVPK